MADVFRFKNISQTLKGRVHFARHLLYIYDFRSLKPTSFFKKVF